MRARVCRRSTETIFWIETEGYFRNQILYVFLGDGREITAAYLQTDVDTRCAGNRHANEAARPAARRWQKSGLEHARDQNQCVQNSHRHNMCFILATLLMMLFHNLPANSGPCSIVLNFSRAAGHQVYFSLSAIPPWPRRAPERVHHVEQALYTCTGTFAHHQD